jgi:ER lumen protein retaining receptor
MAMNIFRAIGDGCHFWSIVVLLRRLMLQKNAHGISPKTQVLYLAVFLARYLDLFTTFYSAYNSFMKILFILSTMFILLAIRCSEPLRSTCDTARDTFVLWKVLAPSFLFAMILFLISPHSYGFDLVQLLWTFSICLEPLAILPQLSLVFRYREIESVTWIYEYILFKGAYRALYIVNWIYRAHTEPFYRHHYLVYVCGVIQTLVYADFLLFYVTRKSLIRWMALHGVDVEYVDANEEDGGVQFELLLDQDESESLGMEESKQATHSSHSTTSQRNSKVATATEVKDGFITILE